MILINQLKFNKRKIGSIVTSQIKIQFKCIHYTLLKAGKLSGIIEIKL